MSKQEYQVLHIFSGYGGGISSVILNLIENKEDDFCFDVMAFSYKNGEDFLRRIREMGGNVYQMPRPRVDGYKKFKSYIEKVLSQKKYDAIHCHITGWHSLPFINSARKYGIKNFVFHAHTTRYDSRIDRLPFVQIYNQYLNYKKSVAYLTCSDMAARYIYGEKYLKERTAYLIPNGINEKEFSNDLSDKQRLAYNEEFKISKETLVIGHVGRFSAPKNHSFILEIVNKLKEKEINSVVIFVGTGELFDSIKKMAETMGVLENVRFLGRRGDISSLMQYFDCMILPSINEGLPTVAVECQASGKKMFLSDSITRQCDMELGLLEFLPITNIDMWVDKIESTTSVDCLEKAECINKIAELGFTSKKIGDRYCEIIREIIEKKERIVFIVGGLGGGGAERVVSELATQMSEQNYEVYIIVVGSNKRNYSISKDIKVVDCAQKYNIRGFGFFKRISEIRRNIKLIQPKICISFNTNENIYAILSNIGLKNKLIISERNDPKLYPSNRVLRILRRILYSRGDGFVFQTKEVQAYFSKNIQNRSTVIANPINPRVSDVKKKEKEKCFVTAVRLEPQKNIKMSIDAFALIKKEYPDYYFEIYGEGSMYDLIREYIRKIGLQDAIFLKGFSNNIYEDMSKATAFILSSDYEGMSNSMIEAIALGVPTISTDYPSGGARAIISNGENGLLVPVGDTEALYRAMKKVIEEKELVDSLSKNGMKLRESLSIEKVTYNWIKFCRNILGEL